MRATKPSRLLSQLGLFSASAPSQKLPFPTFFQEVFPSSRLGHSPFFPFPCPAYRRFETSLLKPVYVGGPSEVIPTIIFFFFLWFVLRFSLRPQPLLRKRHGVYGPDALFECANTSLPCKTLLLKPMAICVGPPLASDSAPGIPF